MPLVATASTPRRATPRRATAPGARARALLALAACAAGAGACRQSPTARGVAGEQQGPADPERVSGGVSDAAARGDAARGPVAEPVTFRTEDGWTLAGDWRPGAPGTVVVLVHQLSSNRAEWGPLIARLQRRGSAVGVLAFDLRGHGQSVNGPDGRTTWQAFGNDTTQWAGVATDVAAAVTFLRNRAYLAGNLVLVGSSIGSSAALRHAADDASVSGVVMLSPGLNYRGIDTLEPMERYVRHGRPAYLLAAVGDSPSAAALDELRRDHAPDAGRRNHASVSVELYSGTGAHGVAMGAPGVHPEMWDQIDAWIRRLGSGAPVDATASGASDGGGVVEPALSRAVDAAAVAVGADAARTGESAAVGADAARGRRATARDR